MWHTDHRLAVPGHAGTGKTVVAMEMAWRLAQENFEVLLVCANQTLADHLRDRQRADARPAVQPFQIRSIRELVEHGAKAGGQRRGAIGSLDVTKAADQVVMASNLADNLHALAGRGAPLTFDAVLVYEAQDLNEPLWQPLRQLVRDSTSGYFYVFYDLAQRDLPGPWKVEWTGVPTSPMLVTNCRNTRPIYNKMAEFNPLLTVVAYDGPDGRPIACFDPREHQSTDLATPPSDEETCALERALDLLTGPQGGLRPEQILIITCRSAQRTRWRLQRERNVGRHLLRWIGDKASGFVALSTIRSSKGMEAPVVILAELDGVENEPRRDALLYTAISRARNHLVVLGPPDALHPRRPGWWERIWARG